MEPSELLQKFVAVLDELKVPYRIVGSVAAMTYGEPRFTNDIDVVVDLKLEQADQFCGFFPAEEFYCYRDAIVEAIRGLTQFYIIHYESGIKIDVFIPGPGSSNETLLARGRRVVLMPGFDAWFASPEDVILKKLEYFREGGSEKHVGDIAGILKVQQERIDRDYIAPSARRLGLEEVWLDVLQRLDHP
jgi:hypothetical protein